MDVKTYWRRKQTAHQNNADIAASRGDYELSLRLDRLARQARSELAIIEGIEALEDDDS